jgi:hypothetical protein
MISLELEPLGAGTRVTMDEQPIEGVIGAVHTRVGDAVLKLRNDVALDRLRELAEGRR